MIRMAMDFQSLTEATSGAVGGLLSTAILYPLDTCKSKYQAQVQRGEFPKYRNVSDVLLEAISSGQIRSLYQGLGTKSLQSVISQFIYFYSYSYFKQLYLRQGKNKSMGMKANLVVAAASGACTVVITQPLDTASTQMQTSEFGKSKGLWETLSQRPWKEAFDGLGASLLLTINPAIQYTVFEQLKQRLLLKQKKSIDQTDMIESSPAVISAFSAFLLGAFSKTLAMVMTYPAIRCKALNQATQSNENKELKMNAEAQAKLTKSMLDALHIIWRTEGTVGFYKGLWAQILKTILSSALLLMIKEKISRSTWVLMVGLRRWLLAGRKRIKQH